jgi:non-specific serine/threonine protein kinase
MMLADDRRWWSGQTELDTAKRICEEQPNIAAAIDFVLNETAEDVTGLNILIEMFYLSPSARWCDETHRRLEHLLSRDRHLPPAVHARALYGAGMHSLWRRNGRARNQFKQCSDIAKGQPELRLEQGLAEFGLGLTESRDSRRADAHFRRAIQLLEGTPGHIALTHVLLHLADEIAEREPAEAHALSERALRIVNEHGGQFDIGRTALCVGIVRIRLGLPEEAEPLLKDALKVHLELPSRTILALQFEGLAWLAGLAGKGDEAAQLLGKADCLREETGMSLPSQWTTEHERCTAAARALLGQRGFDRAFRTGAQRTIQNLVTYLNGTPGRSDDPPDTSPVSRREVEVAELVSTGATNRQIAAKLTISDQTAKAHVSHILRKLGFSSRAEIATWYSSGSWKHAP